MLAKPGGHIRLCFYANKCPVWWRRLQSLTKLEVLNDREREWVELWKRKCLILSKSNCSVAVAWSVSTTLSAHNVEHNGLRITIFPFLAYAATAFGSDQRRGLWSWQRETHDVSFLDECDVDILRLNEEECVYYVERGYALFSILISLVRKNITLK